MNDIPLNQNLSTQELSNKFDLSRCYSMMEIALKNPKNKKLLEFTREHLITNNQEHLLHLLSDIIKEPSIKEKFTKRYKKFSPAFITSVMVACILSITKDSKVPLLNAEGLLVLGSAIILVTLINIMYNHYSSKKPNSEDINNLDEDISKDETCSVNTSLDVDKTEQPQKKSEITKF